MFSILCDDCKDELVMDVKTTTEAYIKDDWKYEIDLDTGKLFERSVQKYLIYKCRGCKKIYKLTYKEWEERFRMEIAREAMEVKKMMAFKDINPSTVSADNGLEFCGQCSGYAGDGYCLIDIIRQCTIRKD